MAKYTIPPKATAQQVHDLLQKYSAGLDLRNASHATRYKNVLKELFRDINAFEKKIFESVTTLTRARKHKEPKTLFTNKSDLWYPPNKYAQINRANDYGEPVYYCSSDPGTTIFEVRPKKVGEWITTLDLDFQMQKIDLLAVGIELTDVHKSTLSEGEKGLHMFLRDKFTTKVDPEENYLYHLTIAFIDLYSGKKDGVTYPSVASNLKGYNMALKRNFIDKYGDFSMATVHEVTAIKSEYEMEVKCMYRAYELDEYEDFKWERVTDCDGHLIDESIYDV